VRSTRQVVEELYRAFVGADKDGMLGLLHPDVEVSFLGQVYLHGIAAADRFFDFAGGLLRDVQFTLDAVLVDGDVAAGIWHETAMTASGQPWENHGVDVVHVRDGLVVALHENNDVRAVLAHFPRYAPESVPGSAPGARPTHG
jgi:ketosteroid isomerase-like protein